MDIIEDLKFILNSSYIFFMYSYKHQVHIIGLGCILGKSEIQAPLKTEALDNRGSTVLNKLTLPNQLPHVCFVDDALPCPDAHTVVTTLYQFPAF